MIKTENPGQSNLIIIKRKILDRKLSVKTQENKTEKTNIKL